MFMGLTSCSHKQMRMFMEFSRSRGKLEKLKCDRRITSLLGYTTSEADGRRQTAIS